MSAGSDSELMAVTVEDDGVRPSYVMPLAFNMLPLLIGVGIAEGIHRGTGFTDYVAVIETDLRPKRLYWLYFSALILAVLTRWLNGFGMAFKNAAMEAQGKAAKGNIRANMYLYRSLDDPSRGATVLMEAGAAGQYNRANRSLHHYIENLPGFFLCLPLAGYVYPAACFVLTCLFAIGRVLHQIGYSMQGYGGHGAGFGVSLVCTVTLEGLTFVAGMRAAGAPF